MRSTQILHLRIRSTPMENLESNRFARNKARVEKVAGCGHGKKLKLQYPTVTARLHAEIDEKITIFIEMKKFLKSKIFKVKNIFKVD